MTSRTRGVTVVIQRDGTTRSRTVRLPLWALRLGTLGGAGLLAGLGLLAILYFPVARAALRVPGLERKVARLEAENAMVRQLSIALAQSDLTLEQGATSWVLRRSGATRRTSAPDYSPQPPR